MSLDPLFSAVMFTELLKEPAVFYGLLFSLTAFIIYRQFGPQSTDSGVPMPEESVKVTKILVHPIKSCRGTSVQEAKWTPEGLEYDRRWILVVQETHKFITARDHPKMVLITPTVNVDTASPYGGTLDISFPPESDLSAFSVPLAPTAGQLKEWEYITNVGFWSKAQLDGYVVQAISPSSTSSSSTPNLPSAILSEYLGLPVHLIYKGPQARRVKPTTNFPSLPSHGVAHFQDGYPLFFASEESLANLREKVERAARETRAVESLESEADSAVTGGSGNASGVDDEANGELKNELKWRIGKMNVEKWKDASQLNIERFRPNIVIAGTSQPWIEDTWSEVSIGEDSTQQRITVVSKCVRCLVPNVETNTGVRDDAIPYKVMSKFRNVDPGAPYAPCFGVNAVPTASSPFGVVRVGDRVRVTRVLSLKELEAVTKRV